MYTNEILKKFGGLGDLQFPIPTYYDSFIQFFKNYTSIGIIALILSYMGVMSREKDKKTVYLMLTKGLSRKGMYLAKLLASYLMYTIIYVTSCIIFYVYTYILFGSFPTDHVVLAFAIYWIFGLFILAMTLFNSNLTNNVSVSASLSLFGYFSLFILAQFSAIKRFIPSTLTTLPLELITDSIGYQDCLLTVLSTIGIIVLLTIGGISIYQEQEL